MPSLSFPQKRESILAVMDARLRRHDVTIKDVLKWAIQTLQSFNIESAAQDARILTAHVLQCSIEQLLANSQKPISNEQLSLIDSIVARRAKHIPVAQLIGKREFFGLEFQVTKDTLDPRPDSETLIELALELFPDRNAPLNILDLGTGTGCLVLTLLHLYPNATGVGVDMSQSALAVARHNAARIAPQAQFIESRWCEKVTGMFNLIISNPPYIETGAIEYLMPEVRDHEPRSALDGGADGLHEYRQIIAEAQNYLTPGGILLLEIGQGQETAITELFKAHSLKPLAQKKDLGGIIRALAAAGA